MTKKEIQQGNGSPLSRRYRGDDDAVMALEPTTR
jgi:hypothetical protein